MANINASAIQTAIREALEDGHGSVRTISSGTYQGALFDSLATNEQSRRALVNPRIEPRISNIERHPSSPSVIGNLALYQLEVQVTLVRHLNLKHKTKDSARDDVRALAAQDGDVIAQSLTYPNNLNQDASGNSTGIVSGMLRYTGSSVGDVELTDNEPGRVSTVHSFNCVVQVTT